MIAKILSTSGGFQGIDYNERKTKNGKGDLLEAKNFGILEMKESTITKKEYIAYMQKFCESNPKVKSKQFHAVISCKGEEYSADQLRSIGSQYLNKMGYSNNPYLIYFHSDTQNNHVHVVSTRVDENGKKIDDSYEKLRSMSAIKEILGLSMESEYKVDLDKVFAYSYSSNAQFMLLFEKLGYKVLANDSLLSVIKYGSLQGEIPLEFVTQRMKQGTTNVDRVDQLKAIFSKYKNVHSAALEWKGAPLPGNLQSTHEGENTSVFSKYMSDKFGLQLVFHQKEGKVPYGYTIIDHSSKQVLKGSQVMGLKELLAEVPKQEKIAGLKTVVEESILAKSGLMELENQLLTSGFVLGKNGEIKSKGEPGALYQISQEEFKQLHYQKRLKEATQVKVTSPGAQYILANQYKIRLADIVIEPTNFRDHHAVGGKLTSILKNATNINEGLSRQGLEVFIVGEEVFISDKENALIVSAQAVLTKENYEAFIDVLHQIDYVVIDENKNLEKQAEEFLIPEKDESKALIANKDLILGTIELSEKEPSFIYQQPGISQDMEKIFGSIRDEKEPSRRKRKR